MLVASSVEVMVWLLACASGGLSLGALGAAVALGRTALRLQSDALWWTAGGILAVGGSSGFLSVALWLPGYDTTVAALEIGAGVLFAVSTWRLTCATDSHKVERTLESAVLPDEDDVARAHRLVDLASSHARPSWGRMLSSAPVLVAAVNDKGELVRVDGGLTGVKESARASLTYADIREQIESAKDVCALPMDGGRLIIALGHETEAAC